MKTLIIGAGPLGSLYACLMQQAGKDVTILARNEHFAFLRDNGVALYNEFTQEKTLEKIEVINSIAADCQYDLAIILMRKNSVLKILPDLSRHDNIKHFLFMGNNALGFDEYVQYLQPEKILFGFPGGGGSRIDHVAHYVDSEKPNGPRFPVVLGEIDGKVKERTNQIKTLFESSGIPVKIVADMDSWLKYHVAFVLPIAGALLKSGDNYKLARDDSTIRSYIRAVNEGSKVLRVLGYKKSYNVKLRLFYWMPESMIVKILHKVFASKFAEVAMMMHVNAAGDEMTTLWEEFRSLIDQTDIETPNFDILMGYLP